jgi:hypothetical protein
MAVQQATHQQYLDWAGAPVEAECPPEDIYNFVIKSVSDLEEKPGYNEGDTDFQLYAEVELYGYPYDDEDEDDTDWNGTTCRVYCVLGRRYAKKPEHISPVWKSERSNARPFLEAILPDYPWNDKSALAETPLDIAWEGKRFRAVVKPNDKGWPRLSGFMPPKKSNKPNKRQATPPPEDDDDLFTDEV